MVKQAGDEFKVLGDEANPTPSGFLSRFLDRPFLHISALLSAIQ